MQIWTYQLPMGIDGPASQDLYLMKRNSHKICAIIIIQKKIILLIFWLIIGILSRFWILYEMKNNLLSSCFELTPSNLSLPRGWVHQLPVGLDGLASLVSASKNIFCCKNPGERYEENQRGIRCKWNKTQCNLCGTTSRYVLKKFQYNWMHLFMRT